VSSVKKSASSVMKKAKAAAAAVGKKVKGMAKGGMMNMALNMGIKMIGQKMGLSATSIANVQKQKTLMKKLKILIAEMIEYTFSPPFDLKGKNAAKGLKEMLVRFVRSSSIRRKLCRSGLTNIMSPVTQFHGETPRFSQGNTCWSTDAENGCKGEKKKNEYVVTGDEMIAKLLDSKKKGGTIRLGRMYKTTGVREAKRKFMPLSNAPDAVCDGNRKTCDPKPEKSSSKRKSRSMDLKPTSSVTDTVLGISSCNKKTGCRIRNTKEAAKKTGKKFVYVKYRTIMCLARADITFGLCNTCCCKGGMVQYKVGVSLLHKTSGYGCAKNHQLMDWIISMGASGFKLKKVVEMLGMNRVSMSGNGCLD